MRQPLLTPSQKRWLHFLDLGIDDCEVDPVFLDTGLGDNT